VSQRKQNLGIEIQPGRGRGPFNPEGLPGGGNVRSKPERWSTAFETHLLRSRRALGRTLHTLWDVRTFL
jgi:hypothetical protein